MPYLFLTFHARTLRSGPVPVRVRDPAGVHARDRLPLPGERPGGEDKGEGHQGQEDQEERLPDGVLGKGARRPARPRREGGRTHPNQSTMCR